MTHHGIFRLTAVAAVIASSVTLFGCDNNDNNNPPKGTEGTTFAPLSAAATDGEKRQVRSSDFVTINDQTREIGYQTILRSGERRGDSANANTFGLLVDNAGLPLLMADGSTSIADSNDFSSLLPVGGKLFAVSQFESQPGAMFLTELSQDTETGKLTAVKTTSLDLSSIHGIWNPCAGSVTPWNTHLGSEEYEADAASDYQNNPYYQAQTRYFGGGSVLGGNVNQGNPYFWGYPVEVTVTNSNGDYSVAKHYSMGRFAHELSYVMPDNKTVYQSDDGTNVGLFMYVADTAGALSSGTLYAMKWNQTSDDSSDLGTADIDWIELGHASDTEIATLINSGVEFSDIFDTAAPSNGNCPAGYTSVNANGIGLECLKLNTGMEKAAAFLETRRYAGYVGATTEFRKEEGITFDPDAKRLYVAYSEVARGMENFKKAGAASTSYDLGTSNDVQLNYNVCGAIYGFDVDDSFVATKAEGILAGRMTTKADSNGVNPSTIEAYADNSPFAANVCDIDGIANPDNISFMAGQKTLLIGEDAGSEHQNDAIWAFNVETEALTRIATTPYGAETTSLYYYPNVNEFGYIMAVVQHPYGESDTDKVDAESSERRSYLGYIGALPAYE